MNKKIVFLFSVGIAMMPLMARDVECRTTNDEREDSEERRMTNDERGSSSFLLGMTNQQVMEISGTVSDAKGFLPRVTVSVKGKETFALSDSSGKYSIIAESTDTLVFSFVGYTTLEVVIGDRTLIDAVLLEDATNLQEVTVNAGYYRVKDSERTGSIAKITAKDIETQPVTNFLATMQGRMAGVNITQQTGTAGGGFTVQIRGQNSVRRGGNAPLYIVDGVPYSSEDIGNGISMAVMSMNTNPLNTINPADIESLEVLKDADATAIYGSRGANGVVLITTKKGKKGKTRFSASVAQGAGRVGHFMEMMNTEQYLAMRREAFANDGITEYPENAYDVNGTWDQSRYTDWQKKILGGTSRITNVNATVSGGSEQTQFLLSGTYGKEGTVFPGDFGYDRINVRSTLNHESTDKRFKVALTTGYSIQENDQPSKDITLDAISLAPNAPALYDAMGELNWENNTFQNPLRYLNGLSKSKTNDLVANTTLSYNLLKNLIVKSSFGYTDLSHHESSTYPSTLYNPSEGLGSEVSNIFYTDTQRQSWIAEPQINYTPTFKNVRTDFLVGATFQRQDNKSLSMQGSGYTSNSMIYNPAAATDLLIMGFDESVYKYQSVFGRGNFNWKERYIVNLTGRRDGSSRFGPGNRFGWFGAVGAAWLFSREKLFENNTVLSFGKLRASYGTTGNDQIGNYQFLNTYTPSTANYDGVIGLEPSRLFNAGFGWETNRKLEVALETGLFKDRIFFTAAWYRNRSSNQLVGVPLPGTTGFTEIQANLNAAVINSGVELTLNTVNLKGKDFGWNTSFNFSTSRNKLLSFPNLESSTYSNSYVIGQPLNIVKVFHYTGVDPETGIYTFEDVNGDGVLTDVEDRQTVKDLNPKFFGGLQNQFRYKNWQLDFLFQFVKQENYNIARTFGLAGTMINQPTEVLGRWQVPGDSGPAQIYTSGANGAAENALYQYGASDAGITDASYIRLKNVAISYTFSKAWLKYVDCKLSLEAQNVLTITNFKGADPEFVGIGYLPPLRMITAGLQFNF